MKYFTSRAYPVLFIVSAFCLSAVWLSLCHISTAQSATVPATSVPSYGPVIRGTLLDGTQDYSERQFKQFERIVAGTDAEKGPDKAFTDALTQLIGPRGPMPGVTVTLRKKSTTPEAREFLLKTITDSQGKFNFSDVREGEYTVTAEIRRGWLAGRTEVQRQVKHYRSWTCVPTCLLNLPAITRSNICDRARIVSVSGWLTRRRARRLKMNWFRSRARRLPSKRGRRLPYSSASKSDKPFSS